MLGDDYKNKKRAPAPDGSTYHSKKKKPPRKKADHKHIFEPVILRWENPHYLYTRDKGFVSGIDFCQGSRCIVCKKLIASFPKNHPDYRQFYFQRSYVIPEKYPDYPIIDVKSIYSLEEKEAQL